MSKRRLEQCIISSAFIQQYYVQHNTHEADACCSIMCPLSWDGPMITLMSSGVSLLLRSFLCTHRKLISTMPLVLPRMQMVAGTAAQTVNSGLSSSDNGSGNVMRMEHTEFWNNLKG